MSSLNIQQDNRTNILRCRETKKGSILFVDDDPNSLYTISNILRGEGYKVITAENGEIAIKKMYEEIINLIVTDLSMPGIDGMGILKETKRFDKAIPVILVTGYGSVETAVDALKDGAFYFFEKPLYDKIDNFFVIIEQALKNQCLENEVYRLQRELDERYSLGNIIGKSKKMREVYKIIERIAPTDKTILIQGESGTGKELTARAIHQMSSRMNKSFVSVNCGALTETLLTSELFGHVRGAFTGAYKDRKGKFELAEGGTLLLDDVTEISLHLQKNLLRVLQEREFEKVGGERTTKMDARIIATANKDLFEEVKAKRFREDLYYRLNIVPLHLPPLRERIDDIPLFIEHFFNKHKVDGGNIRIMPEVVEYMKEYAWPGNVREIENLLQQMMVLCYNNTITVSDLPPYILLNRESGIHQKENISLPAIIREIEEKRIKMMLKRTDWNREKAAKLLGISRKMLNSRIKKYGLKA